MDGWIQEGILPPWVERAADPVRPSGTGHLRLLLAAAAGDHVFTKRELRPIRPTAKGDRTWRKQNCTTMCISATHQTEEKAVRRGVDILCVQETKWRGQKAKEVEDTDFKLWYTGTAANRNGVDYLIGRAKCNRRSSSAATRQTPSKKDLPLSLLMVSNSKMSKRGLSLFGIRYNHMIHYCSWASYLKKKYFLDFVKFAVNKPVRADGSVRSCIYLTSFSVRRIFNTKIYDLA
ncbi:uncharacterized protein [Triticum aestivum]|uniref:uncharacterized protein n=1 Tax=Triticum aestivum TaxID=4565 RepID=UPI001D022860|nr:uncharacterized protein LOC123189394 [Triticum aestivum]XP_044457732.1 uncharacterized protein LOC123189394 [Triticum aestivum]XP_044457733.1 uncharacterized protein LOC123189394 [Triticum aestivum]XP_044457734.1 uncharacterized protein LOC123189394 [Triticum aestivum]XP_044457735.1 uncharacterized protein LOC123189394 [Triticum aestivum]XP_044457736.1 uncharacterized protein LOC123189394 [Triticum aestivum]XP_044457737.1 uncharacterized protein LOC123189394 [Triticum aestivum]XP_04445773